MSNYVNNHLILSKILLGIWFLLGFPHALVALAPVKILWSNQMDLSSLIDPTHYSPSGSGIRSDGTIVVLWYRRQDKTEPETEWPVILTWRNPHTMEWSSLEITEAWGHRYMWILGDGRILIGMGNHYPGSYNDFRNDLYMVSRNLSTYQKIEPSQAVPHSDQFGSHDGPGVFNPSSIVLGNGEFIFHGAGDHLCGTISDFYVAQRSENAEIWSPFNLPNHVGLKNAQAIKLDESRVLIIGGTTQSECINNTAVSAHYLVTLSENGIPISTTMSPQNGIVGPIGTTLVLSDGRVVNFSYLSDSTYETDNIRILDSEFTHWTSYPNPVEEGMAHPDWKYFFEGQSNIVSLGNNHFLFVGGRNPTSKLHHSKVTEMKIVNELFVDDLVAYYPFNNNAKDETNHGFDGIVNGPVLTTDRFGNEASAYYFDGEDDYIQTSPNPLANLGNGDFTISVQVNFERVSETTSLIHIGEEIQHSQVEDQIQFYLQHTGKIVGWIHNENSGYKEVKEETLVLPDTWYHLVLTRDNNRLKLYQNGQLKSAAPADYDLSHTTFNEYVTLGVIQVQNAANASHFQGKMDDVRLFKKALSDSEVQQLYEQETGLLAHYPLNGNVNDASSNQLHGVLTGDPVFLEDNGEHYLQFDGVDDFIWVGNQLQPKTLTLSVWVKSAKSGTLLGFHQHGFELTTEYGVVSVSPEVRYTSQESPILLGDMNWHHLGLTFGAEGLKMYLDGQLHSETPLIDSQMPIHYEKSGFSIGRAGAADQSYFQGSLDNIKIYKRPFSENEMQTLYQSERAQHPDLSTGLVAHYSFDGNAQDQSGLENHGTPTQGTQFINDLQRGKIIELDGHGVDLGQSVGNFGNGDFTVATWLYLKENSYNTNTIYSKGSTPSNPHDLYYITENTEFRMDLNNTNDPMRVTYDAYNHWAHVAVTRQDTTTQFYLNGILEYTTSRFQTNSDVGNAFIGKQAYADSGYFKGKLDDFRIYQRALSSNEINALIPQESGLVAYYPFNGNAKDATGQGSDGMVQGATLTTDRFGNANRAYAFDGESAILFSSITPTLRQAVAGPHTFSVWIYSTKSKLSGSQFILDGCNQTDQTGLRLLNQKVYFRWETSNDTFFTMSPDTVPLHKWYHVAGTYDGVMGRIYIDGKPVSQQISSGTATEWTEREYSMAIGNISCSINRTPKFTGKIDDVRIYNRALSNEEVESLYQRESGKEFVTLENVKQIEVGYAHACALLEEGRVKCWGYNRGGQLGNGSNVDSYFPTFVENIFNAIQISLNDNHTCALLDTGRIKCWGSGRWGSLGNGNFSNAETPIYVHNIENAVKISNGTGHSCAILEDLTAQCWGYGVFGQLGNGSTNNSSIPVVVQGLTSVAEISTGGSQSCAILTDGSVHCWGQGKGILGIGNSPDYSVPVLVSSIDNVKNISSSFYGNCVALADKTVSCWGGNTTGNLGTGNTSTLYFPKAVEDLSNVISVDIGDQSACALLGDGTIKCWGTNRFGNLGTGNTISSYFPVSVKEISNAIQISVGYNSMCAILEGGSLKCWGSNSRGNLGHSTSHSFTPKTVKNLSNAVQISSGSYHSCAIINDNSVKCWGINSLGQLGNGSKAYVSTPVVTKELSQVEQISAGGDTSCALRRDGYIHCWGRNHTGQFGNGDKISSSIPVLVQNISNVKQISVNVEHVCALQMDGVLKCWGTNEDGQLGNQTNSSSAIPVTVNGISDVHQVSTGLWHSCVLANGDDTNGYKIYCWGDGNSGQLGHGSYSNSSSPVLVEGISNAIQLTSGNNHNCALLITGAVLCWGAGISGQLGNNSTLKSSIPVLVNDITSAIQVVASANNSCALMENRTVYCWGQGHFGQLNDEKRAISTVPVLIDGLADVIEISAGYSHMCALIGNGTVKCWGDAYYGQLGDGNAWSTVPQSVLAPPSLKVNMNLPLNLGTVIAGESLTFTTNGSGGIRDLSYSWDFGGATENSMEEDPGSVTFTNAGTYVVSVTVEDEEGQTVTETRTIKVEVDETPQSVINTPQQQTTTISVGQSVDFTGTGSRGNGNLSYIWDFEGGASNVTSEDPGEIVFSVEGTYSITLTVKDEDGDTDQDTRIIEVKAESPVDFGQLIIVAGGGAGEDNNLWPATNTLALQVYRTFIERGFSKEQIYLFHPDASIDLYNIGEYEAISNETAPTVQKLKTQILRFQSSDLTGPLHLYLIDHGAEDKFQITPYEILQASELDQWLDDFQETTQRKVVVAIEACYSGSFIDDLAQNDRIVVTSSEPDAVSYIDAEGKLSYSSFLLERLYYGDSFQTAHEVSLTKLSKSGRPYNRMNPQIYHGGYDSVVGGHFSISDFTPQIITYEPVYDIDGKANTFYDLRVQLTDHHENLKVWAMVTPPDFTPPTISKDFNTPQVYLPQIEFSLEDSATHTYRGRFKTLAYEGDYQVQFFARMPFGGLVVSEPISIKVNDGNPVEQLNDYTPNIQQGWKLIGVNHTLLGNTVADQLVNLWSSIESVWTWNPESSNWQIQMNGHDLNQFNSNYKTAFEPLTKLKPGQGVWVKFKRAAYHPFESAISTTPLNLKTGWNLVALNEGSIELVVERLPKNVVSIWTWTGGGWEAYSTNDHNHQIDDYSLIKEVQGNQGYWVKVR